MATATFYLVKEGSSQSQEQGLFEYVVFLAHHFAKQGAKVFVNADDKPSAEAIAELLWQAKPEDFIAHNLVGEGPKSGTAIEVGHSFVKPSWNRQLVINVANDNTIFAPTFGQVVDFVPCEEKAKQQARERYKIYRQAGYQLQTIEIQYP
ncbi:putative DNA polymerase III chi subunit [Vibrio nigripulchritudo SFn27]|uniref:Putative DNA polymerase III chi subunit n=1 Tax=Vibrio nigripulchritudo TaxID=28173 RepID=U4K8S2_9VIBR|nr:DNA polymerase III subunit chi [Vibrio nigripulchritudo]CCN84841.1 putative DNA polymerase III chi subunit [Vibrio nigripulchritudo BLFn1]CCN87666.1 putative DNA polymerase III chi subunit [Vibrio nigripulchritudo SFn27]CCN95838.1 putative DNA polymerase III chi subunit [Vibrio nigripulchritudo ENn2]CCO38996.1 putative DNA polymerase III chi subunit [Vibrio nigripulchritudo SFn135]CCO51955.1 putative DNA polymerase III chi subunit [Vibrio nigripulchritudo Wn13]